MLQLQFLAGDAAIEQQTLTDNIVLALTRSRATGVAGYITLTVSIISMAYDGGYDGTCVRPLLHPREKVIKKS